MFYGIFLVISAIIGDIIITIGVILIVFDAMFYDFFCAISAMDIAFGTIIYGLFARLAPRLTPWLQGGWR